MAAITMDQAPRELARRRRAQQLPAGVTLPTPTPAPTQPGTITRPGTQDAVRSGQPTSSVPQLPKFKMPGTGGDTVGHYGMPQPWVLATPTPAPGGQVGNYGFLTPGAQQPAQQAGRRDLYQDWLKYQAGGPANVREAFSMDNDLAALDIGDFGGDHGEKNRRLAQALIQRGYAQQGDFDKVFQELQTTGGNWYYDPSQKLRDFGTTFASYNKEDPAQRAAVTKASNFGHSLPDSTALSRAGWQNVTPQQLAQFAQQGFIPAGPLAGGVSSGYSGGMPKVLGAPDSGGYGTGSLTDYGGQPGISMPGQIFDDPTSKLLEDLIKGQIGQLTQPTNDPLRGQYQNVLQSQLEQLQGTGAPGSSDQFRDLLQQEIARFSGAESDEGTQRYLNLLRSQLTGLEGSTPDVDALTSFLRSQFQELSTQPGYSDAERAVMNTQLFEPIEALRKTSQERERARTASAGYLPSSGLHNARQSDSDRYYDQLRTQAYRDMAIDAIDRRDHDLAAAAGVGRDLMNLPLERQSLARGVGGQFADLTSGLRREQDARRTNALGLSRSLVDYDQGQQDRSLQRSGQASGVAGLLAALSQGTRSEEQGRQNQAIQLATLLRQMPMDAQRQAMAVIQGTAPPESLLPMLTTMLNQSNQQGQNFYAMLGQLASLFD